MHQCLLVAELAIRIMEECVPGYRTANLRVRPPPDLRAVWAFAQTCRTLQDHALDVMWYNQCDLENLLRCMPRDLPISAAMDGSQPRWRSQYRLREEYQSSHMVRTTPLSPAVYSYVCLNYSSFHARFCPVTGSALTSTRAARDGSESTKAVGWHFRREFSKTSAPQGMHPFFLIYSTSTARLIPRYSSLSLFHRSPSQTVLHWTARTSLSHRGSYPLALFFALFLWISRFTIAILQHSQPRSAVAMRRAG